MAKRKVVVRVAKRVPGVELLRIAHNGAVSDDEKVQNAAASIYSLIALQLTEEMVGIPQPMMPFYKVLLKA